MKLRDNGFTLAELLIVVTIIGVLVGVSIPVFNSQLDKAKIAVDQSNVRNAKSVAMAEWISDGMPSVWGPYYYDAGSGQMKESASEVIGYGKYTSNDKADIIGAMGTPNKYGIANCVSVSINSVGEMTLAWGSGYGNTYSIYASSEFSNKNIPLTSETSSERLSADIDIAKSIGSDFLGLTKEELIEVTGLNPNYQGRLTNDEGIVIVTYRNQNGENPQLRGDYSAMVDHGYTGDVGNAASNSFSTISDRLFFSDFMNSGAEVNIKIGKVTYDSNDKINSISVWAYINHGNQSDVPTELQLGSIVVSK